MFNSSPSSMGQVTQNPFEDVVDSSFNDTDDVKHPLVGETPPQKQEETSGKDSGSDEISVEQQTSPPSNGNVPKPNSTETQPSARRSGPEDALKEIKTQETHYLYCPVCKSNITKTAELFVKDQETYPYNTKTKVTWVPRFNLSWFSHISIEPRILLAVVLLVLSVSVMWFHDSPVTPPGPPFPEPPPGPISPPILPGPRSSDPPSGPVSPPLLPGPPSPVPPPGPVSPPILPYIKIGWLMHFLRSKYFSIFSLFLVILALLWPYIPRSISYPIFNACFPSSVPPAPAPPFPAQAKAQEDQDQAKAQEDQDQDQDQAKALAQEDKDQDQVSVPFPIPTLTELQEGLQRHIVGPVQNLDILKSIVYGGLIESITSLGVVSSAAASGASTLNVLALGLANLFSGLFLIIHRLRELIDKENENDYLRWLGKKKNFKPYCVVLSFIFFGVVPPLVYGLSFKQTDKGHYKAAMVLVASLVCVISLSLAKAHAFRIGKVRTVAEYTGMAIGASALSFITSQIVSDLLEKHGFHELASDYRKG